MTFDEIIEDVKTRNYHNGHGWLTKEEAALQASTEILQGFLDLDDARQFVTSLRETGNVVFTGWGYEVNADCLEQAIRVMEARR